MPPTSTKPVRPKHRGRLITATVLVLWVAALGAVAANRQNIYDWAKLQDYHPPAAVAAIVRQDTLTGYGRKIFYVNHPQLDNKSTFSHACPNNGGEQTIVLGCYHPKQAGIYLLDVTDPRLDGVEQVTAAHEMLHGAYDRLSSGDRKHVDSMLMDYYNHDLHDQRIRDTIVAYKKSEPNDVVNEMHSVFGTEIAQLPPGLEQYYKRYFTDRARVAAFAAQYQSEFTSRQAIVARDDAKLAGLKAQIQADESDLQTKQGQIDSMQSRLLAQKNSGDITGYNAGVPGYNALIDAYNAEVQVVRSLVTQYNQLVNERNEVALEENQLVKALSTDATPIRR